jgi:hypothetical protein
MRRVPLNHQEKLVRRVFLGIVVFICLAVGFVVFLGWELSTSVPTERPTMDDPRFYPRGSDNSHEYCR